MTPTTKIILLPLLTLAMMTGATIYDAGGRNIKHAVRHVRFALQKRTFCAPSCMSALCR